MHVQSCIYRLNKYIKPNRRQLRLGFLFEREGRFLAATVLSACWCGGTGDTLGVTSEEVPEIE